MEKSKATKDDLLLAVGGGQLIQIISISHTKVIQQIHLKNEESIKDLFQLNTFSIDHFQLDDQINNNNSNNNNNNNNDNDEKRKEIFDYATNLLISLSSNGNIRVWDWPRAVCILCVPPSLHSPSSLVPFFYFTLFIFLN